MSPKNTSTKKTTSLEISEQDRCLWITLPDSINMDSYPGLEEKIESSLSSMSSQIVVDLSKTKNMYSAGFGLIVRLKKMTEMHGGKLYVVHVAPRVVEAMNYLGLQKVVKVYKDGEALDFLENPGS